MNPAASRFTKLVTNRLTFGFFLAGRLPLAWVAGLRLEHLDNEEAVVSVRYGYWTKNPFRSIYFACLTMAAEMSSGLLGFREVYQRQPAVSMLVTGMEAQFVKKATGRIRFVCRQGADIAQAVENTLATGDGVQIACVSTGVDEAGDVVATITVLWSFKARQTAS